MMLITRAQHEQLLKNGHVAQQSGERNHKPVIKLFTPDADMTWFLTELYPDDPDVAFGLCDLGMGFPELGDVRISELEAVRGQFGLPVERDRHFIADKTISEYARDAHEAQYVRV